MRLDFLRLRNFRQHADSEIRFGLGLTGIIGPNGSGKSTILEAVAWAVYGSEAARGTNDTLRFTRAGSRARVEVELAFELGGHSYRVVRGLSQAEVFLDGGTTPVASTVGGVTRYLQGRLGMSRREFFNTYFTGQKELQFLAAMGSTERGKFLSQVLGYERLRQAQDLARTRRTELRHEIAGIRAGMGDPGEIAAARAVAAERFAAARQALLDAQTERAEAAATLAEVAPRWASAQAQRDRFRELTHAIDSAERDREAARREIARAEAELGRIAEADAELAGLREQLAPLPALAEESTRLAELARTNERRKALLQQLAEADTELARIAERIAKVEQAPKLAVRYAAELETARAEQRRTEIELEERKTTWTRDKQDAQTKLQSYRDRGIELKDQIRGIRNAGPEGECPTCERPLGADFARVLDELEGQWAEVVQDGKWWSSRLDQLQPKPDEIAALEARAGELAAASEDRARKHTKCEAAAEELKTLQRDREARAERRATLQREIAELPAGYDPAAHRALDAQLAALRAVENRATRLEETAGRRATQERERGEARERETAAVARASVATAERQARGFTDERFAATQREHDAASERVRRADLLATELHGQLQLAEQARDSAERDEAELRKRAQEVEDREVDLRYHNELDEAFSELRTELNAQVRPELSEIASLFLTQLTDGRYTALEIDDGYNILVLDEGEEKPVISGGEEDVANLVLRLSLSQMIAERAGHPLSLLILDEVFGSLDVARRDNVVQLLRRLEDRFEQVILITHIEGIRESLDQVIRVEFDERTGASVVRSEGGAPEPEYALDGMAAD